MPERSPKLSNTARTVLSLAAERDDHLVRAPQLPAAAARQVIRSLLNAGLVEEIPAPVEDADFAWRKDENGEALMLRATAAGLARITEPETTAVTDDDGEGADAPANDVPALEAPDTSQPLPESVAQAEPTEDGPGAIIQVDASIASLVHTFITEIKKPERAPYVTTFLRRLEGGGVTHGTASTGTNRAREMSISQRKIVKLCSRPEGATGKELAEGCGWPSIAARATCQKIADRFGFVLHESPKANGRGISFRMTAKPAVEA
jgi:hypothetical protein